MTPSTTSGLANFTDKQIVAMTAWGENRSGGDVGMQSVINVIMNRASKSKASPRDVCLAPSQFSCWNPMGEDYKAMMSISTNDPQYTSALYMVNQAYAGVLKDITKGATHYYASGSPAPYWAKGHVPCEYIAGQYFFNDVA